jgi:hypothetical protein
MTRLLVLVLVVVCVVAQTGLEGQELKPGWLVSVSVYPALVNVGPRSSEVRVQWRIEPHPDNRMHSFTMDGNNGHFSSFSEDIDEHSPTTFPLCTVENPRPCFRTVYQGVYTFTACVIRVTEGKEKKSCAKQKVEVV